MAAELDVPWTAPLERLNWIALRSPQPNPGTQSARSGHARRASVMSSLRHDPSARVAQTRQTLRFAVVATPRSLT
jgi:hypothetical protein